MFLEIVFRSCHHSGVFSLFTCQIAYPVSVYFIILSPPSPSHYRLNILSVLMPYFPNIVLLSRNISWFICVVFNKWWISWVKELYLSHIYVLGVVHISCYRMVPYIRHDFTPKSVVTARIGPDVDIDIPISFVSSKPAVLYTL